MLKAVLFDLDGVIVDSEPEYLRTELALAEKLGFHLSKGFQKRYVGLTQQDLWRDLKKVQVIPYTVEELISMESQIIDEYYATGGIVPIPGTVELIRALKGMGVKCAITTSNKDKNAVHTITRLHIEDCISFISSASKVKACKPAPDIFLLAMKELGVQPEKCVAIDDSEMGILGAKAAGVKAIGYISPGSGKQDLSKADYITDDMKSITYELLCSLTGSR